MQNPLFWQNRREKEGGKNTSYQSAKNEVCGRCARLRSYCVLRKKSASRGDAAINDGTNACISVAWHTVKHTNVRGGGSPCGANKISLAVCWSGRGEKIISVNLAALKCHALCGRVLCGMMPAFGVCCEYVRELQCVCIRVQYP